MINQLIAEYLRAALEPISGQGQPISRLAGLVKVLETDRFSPDKKVRKFPIPLDSSPATCRSAGRTFPDLVPDAKDRLIAYFEDSSATSPDGGKKWVSRLRLVGWGNGNAFTVPIPLVQASLMGLIKKQFSRVYVPGGSPVSSLSVSILSAPPAGTNLFAAYTYSETVSQYLLPPYFSFGLDLSITYVLNDSCAPDLVTLTVDSAC